MPLSKGGVLAGGDPSGAGSQGLRGPQAAWVGSNALTQQPEVICTAKTSHCRLPCWIVACTHIGEQTSTVSQAVVILHMVRRLLYVNMNLAANSTWHLQGIDRARTEGGDYNHERRARVFLQTATAAKPVLRSHRHANRQRVNSQEYRLTAQVLNMPQATA